MRATTRVLDGVLAAVLCASIATADAQSRDLDREWPKTDFSKRTVDLSEIESGGPPKDGIPAIDRPRFESTDLARLWLKPKEPVVALRIAREARAYPIQILMFHEIVNDTLGEIPVAVTFCPLCNASMAFDRRVGGRVLDFGTTGRLRYSDLVMYDRQTESWWQQFSGKGIVGRYAGTNLARIASSIVAFEDFAAAYPRGRVLSRETGFFRPYGRNPYVGYDRIDQNPFFPVKKDSRLAPMERVLSVSAGGLHRIYPLTLLESHAVVSAALAGIPYVVFTRPGMNSPLDGASIGEGRPIPAAAAFDRRVAGRVLEFVFEGGRIVDRPTGSAWNILGEASAGPLEGERLAPLADSGVHFAFAWLAFNPDSEIVRSLPSGGAKR
jgi:hypothetical protein